MIGRRGERGSGISVLAARHDDDIFLIPIIQLYRIQHFHLIQVYFIHRRGPKKYDYSEFRVALGVMAMKRGTSH